MRDFAKRLLILLPAAALAAAPALAQGDEAADSASSDSEITVTGMKDVQPVAVHHQARVITPQVDLRTKPLARFHLPVCPGVVGLPKDLAGFVADRIRFNAKRVGLHVAESLDCKPDVIVAFVPDGGSAIRAMNKVNPSLISGLDYYEKRKVLDQTGPARAWSVVRLRSPSGCTLRAGTPNNFADIVNTRLHLNVRSDIELSVVLIDYAAIDGLSATQIADYVTMRGLALTQAPDDQSAYGTILSLFDAGSMPPGEMTAFDIAYLKSVNSSLDTLSAAHKIGGVYGKMRKEVAAQEDGVEADPATIENPRRDFSCRY